MTYNEFEQLISSIRLAKYKAACSNNHRRTLKLYRANVRLSSALLAVLGMFEVVLRNKIDEHYKAQFPSLPNNPQWLLVSTYPGGFLTQNGCHSSLININKAYADLGSRYTHDKLVASLSFGFWKYLFKGHQYMAGGNTLLRIFPNRPRRTNQSDIFIKLDRVNQLRNRVAHHEPVCFGAENVINTTYVRSHFQEIIDLLNWMGVNGQQLFTGVDGVLNEANFINTI